MDEQNNTQVPVDGMTDEQKKQQEMEQQATAEAPASEEQTA